MGQCLLKVRVRPPRVAVLIDKDADESDLFLAFEFFSKLWAGRFAQLLAVDSKSCEDLTLFRLGVSRPEFVYGIGLDDDHWRTAVLNACQPRGFGRLQTDYVKAMKQPTVENYYLVDHALIHLFQSRDQRKSYKQTLRLVTPKDTPALSVYCAATFGIHQENLWKEFIDLDTSFTGTSAITFVELVTEFVKERQQSWLDVTGHELNPRTSETGPLAPTVVLVRSKIADLSLFWNLRTASDTMHPAWIIPIPAESAVDLTVFEKLKEWLLAFLPYGPRPNFCQVTSQTVAESICRDFAAQFQTALIGTPIESVYYQSPQNRLPVVVPFEYETSWAVEVTGRKLTIQPPRPKAFENVGSTRSWVVDLLKDLKTGRAVQELQLPPSPVVFELLNGPYPPNVESARIPRMGDGTDSINLICSETKEVVNVFLPTSEEIFGEILREHGMEPQPDEKRSSYQPVIKRFGGLFLAASAFSGEFGSVLRALITSTRTLSEIQGTCRLGKGELTGDTYLQRIECMFQMETERMKRVSRHRFLEYAKHFQPENLKLRSLLEYWVNRGILTRHWKIGPCSRCNQQYFIPRLNIQRRIICTNCGNRISLPASVAIGYALQRPVAHAILEGIIPVAQTGRFLQGMTNQGFFWLPGFKYKLGNQSGDIDLLACCDGHLVFCECKCLEETPDNANVWNEVVNQFLETARIAKLCKASIVVLASRVRVYPSPVEERIKAALGSSIPYLLLDRGDLETGHRTTKEGDHLLPLFFSSLIPTPFPERPREPTAKPRTINMGWASYTQ